MTLTLLQARVVTPLSIIERGAVSIGDDGTVLYVGPAEGAPELGGEHLMLPGCTVAPGFLDIHTHGGHGISFGAGEDWADALRAYSAWAATTGVTGFLLSVAAPDAATLRALVQRYAEILEGGAFPGAQPLGLHLEGPYLNPEQKGTFHPAWLRPPVVTEVEALLGDGKGWIRQMTLAPELPHAYDVAALLREAGVTASLGHSNTDYATAATALVDTFTHVTHTFNAQRGFHHREPGVLGAVLSSDSVTAELIADTVHVHPGAMKVMLRCLGPERIVLVTDAMAAAGLGDGQYELLGQEVFVRNGAAKLASGTIAGSAATMIQCLRNMVRVVGVSLPEAIRMSTLNPARALRLEHHHGLLGVGRDATMVVLDPDMVITMTLVKGQVVHSMERAVTQ
ncbi:MAG: N-acetylglucosamine-6-phosphate deacetylase [Anaerolineae bacterium]|jgi:N-acetylglucosamine-6-phosphate deacetylase|nr:N-acetylglucosamine-6-phosphate deacetylase [Anaerolineae bacterium]